MIAPKSIKMFNNATSSVLNRFNLHSNRDNGVKGSLRLAKQWTKVLGWQNFNMRKLSPEELIEVSPIRAHNRKTQLIICNKNTDLNCVFFFNI